MTNTDMETCSWCTDEVPDATLVEQPDGARICKACVSEEGVDADNEDAERDRSY